MMKKKKWRCLDCGYEFETEWKPYWLVTCPECGSKNVVRIDKNRSMGAGSKWRRGLCKKFKLF